MKKIITSVFLFLLFPVFSCSRSQLQPEMWEGFAGDRMRVVISEFFMPDENNPDAIPHRLIKERVAQRGSLLLASYVNINLPREKVSPESDAVFNKLINDSISASKLILSECSENNFCTVITDFDIAPVNRELEKKIKSSE